jgi:hypothetical protein
MNHNPCTLLATTAGLLLVLALPVLSPDLPNWIALVIGRILVHTPTPVADAVRRAAVDIASVVLWEIRAIAWSLPLVAGTFAIGMVTLWIWLRAKTPEIRRRSAGL